MPIEEEEFDEETKQSQLVKKEQKYVYRGSETCGKKLKEMDVNEREKKIMAKERLKIKKKEKKKTGR